MDFRTIILASGILLGCAVFGTLIGKTIEKDFQSVANAATLKELGCYESLYFNNPCNDDLYSYCDSTGDGYYDAYYYLVKKGFNLEPVRLEMSPEESMRFYREQKESKCRD